MKKYLTRTHKIHISKYHKYFKTIDRVSFKAKNLYNSALYIERQLFFSKEQFINNFELYKQLKETQDFKDLHLECSALPQQTLKLLYQNITSYRQSTKEFFNNPTKFKAQPKLPKYKNRTKGRLTLDFNYTMFIIQNNSIIINSLGIELPIPTYLKGIQKKKNQTTFSLDELDESNSTLELQQIRIVPTNNSYTIELIYTKQLELQDTIEIKNAASIDLGINNLVTLTTTLPKEPPILISGRYLKSYNKNFNRRLSNLKSKAKKQNNQHTTKLIDSLYKNRNNYFNTNLHQVASYIIKYLTKNNIQLLIVGYNKQWKQNSKLSKNTNQTFIQIPYLKLIQILQYKCYENNIIFKVTNEAYTSGTSFIDNESPSQENYNKSRRTHRGLFLTTKGIKINADVNASYQIMKKELPKLTNKPSYCLKPLNPKRLKPNEIQARAA